MAGGAARAAGGWSTPAPPAARSSTRTVDHTAGLHAAQGTPLEAAGTDSAHLAQICRVRLSRLAGFPVESGLKWTAT